MTAPESTPGRNYRLPGFRVLRSWSATSTTRSARVVFRHLDGFLLLHGADILQPASDPGVHPVSGDLSVTFPGVCSRPSKPSLPAQRPGRDETSEWGPVTRSVVADEAVHPAPCPPVVVGSHPPSPFRETPSSATAVTRSCLLTPADRPTHLRAFLHARVRCRTHGCPYARPDAPWGLGIRFVPRLTPPKRHRARNEGCWYVKDRR